METEVMLGLAGVASVIIGMQFKMNRCIGRIEGKLEAHLKK